MFVAVENRKPIRIHEGLRSRTFTSQAGDFSGLQMSETKDSLLLETGCHECVSYRNFGGDSIC